MLIRFVYTLNTNLTIQKLREETKGDEDKCFLFRKEGFRFNIALFNLVKDCDAFKIMYTDDETMLQYLTYDYDIHNYDIEVMFEESDGFIPLKNIYPNMREVNNLTKMFHSGIISSMYQEYKEKSKE